MAEDIKEIGEPEASPTESEILGETEETAEETPEIDQIEESNEQSDLPNLTEDEETTEEVEEKEPEPELEVDLSPRDKELVKKVAEKYPKVLKEFPQIRSALYRDKEFSKVFENPAEAKEAVEAAETFEYFQDAIYEGNAEVLIDSIAKEDKKSLEKFALNFIPALKKIDQETYDKVVDPLARNLLYAAYRQGKLSKNKNLELAAQHLNAFFFNSNDPSGKNLGFEEKIDPQAQELLNQRQQDFAKNTSTAGKNEITAKIEARLDKSIKGSIRSIIIEKTLIGIGKLLNKDEAYTRQRDSLVRKAARTNYAGDWGTRILSLYTGKATKLLPAVLGVVQKEFLVPGNSPQPKPKVRTNIQGQVPSGKDTKSNVMKPGEKPLDFLSR